MATFEYAISQSAVRSTPTMYTVGVSQTAERAAQKLSQALTGAAQLKATYDKDQYEEALLDQNNKIAAFSSQWENATYEQRKEMMGYFPSMVASGYDEATTYGKQLALNGNKAVSRFQGALFQEGKQVEHNNIITQQNIGYNQAAEDFNNEQDPTKKLAIVNQYKTDYVDPYANIDDPKAQELFNRGLERFSRLDQGWNTYNRAVSDNKVHADVMASIQTNLQVDGEITADVYSNLKQQLGRISNFKEKETQYLQELDRAILVGMRGVFNSNEIPKTLDNATIYKVRLNNLVRMSPNLVGTTAYNDAVTFHTTLVNAANRTDVNALGAMVHNDEVSTKAVEDAGKKLVERNVITQEELDDKIFTKKQNVITRNLKPRITDMYQRGSMDELVDMWKSGNSASVKSVVTGAMETTAATIANQHGNGAAATYVLGEYKKFAEKGMLLGKVDFVESILDAPYKGGLENNDDVTNYVATYEAASRSGYALSSNKKNTQAYAVLKGWQLMGVQNIPQLFEDYKVSSVRVKQADVDEIWRDISDQGEMLTEDLNPKNNLQVRGAIRPAIEAAIKAGMPLDIIEDTFETVVESQFFEVDPFVGTSQRVILPRTPEITKDSYKRLAQTFGGEVYVAPMDIANPYGEWAALGMNGKAKKFSYQEIVDIAQTGMLPLEVQTVFPQASVQTGGFFPEAAAATLPNNGVSKQNAVVSSLYDELETLEGSGDLTGAAPTGDYGMTDALYKTIAARYGNITYKEAAEIHLNETYTFLQDALEGFDNLDNNAQRGILDAAYNMGSNNVMEFENFKAAVKEGDREAIFKNLLDTSNINGQSSKGLAKRRAMSYNLANPSSPIVSVEQLESGKIRYYKSGGLYFTYTPRGGKHKSSKVGKIKV